MINQGKPHTMMRNACSNRTGNMLPQNPFFSQNSRWLSAKLCLPPLGASHSFALSHQKLGIVLH